MLFYLALALLLVKSYAEEQYKVTDQVFLDVAIGDEYIGRIVIGLFGEIAPWTVENFKTLATTGIDGKTYTGSRFHRIIKKFMIQGGDVVNGDGTGSISIFGKSFDDENFTARHKGAGFVSMANKGPNSNGCQFFITTIAAPWLNGRHTVFGKVTDGEAVVRAIENTKTDALDYPVKPVMIKKSGLVHTPKPFYISEEPYSFFVLIKAGTVPLGFAFTILAFFQYVIHKLRKFENVKLHVS